MDKLAISIEIEDSPASNNGIAVFVKAKVNGEEFANIIDIDEFFNSIDKSELCPIFTCECGTFGCGGYYVGVTQSNTAWILKDSYECLDEPDENCKIKSFEYSIPWDNVQEVATLILDEICRLKNNNPDCKIFSGVYGMDLSPKINDYHETLKTIASRVSGDIA